MELLHYFVLLAIFGPLWTLLYYLVPYFTTYKALENIPGPFTAKFSNIWLALQAKKGKKFAAVDLAHRQYGKIVRVGYNHISIADERGLQTVYAHGNGFLKDHFYNAFVSGVTGVFNTRDRIEHTRKRKIVAHAFSPAAVTAFEIHMASNLRRWVTQLDSICQSRSENGYAEINMMPWCTFIAFDIIGDLAFGAPFGMVNKGKDECEAQIEPGGPITYVSGAETLNRRGQVSSTLGLLLPLRPYAKYLPDPFFTKGLEAVRGLHGIAVAAVAKRLNGEDKGQAIPSRRNDILDMLVRSKGPDGNPIGEEELISETLTQLIAGSDTVSNTACAIVYWTLHGERAAPGTILPKLHAELDAAIPETDYIATHAQVKNLPFLRRCIDEGMRIHSTSALGLPRIVTSAEGIEFDGILFPRGTVLSVPSYTIHHDADVWGPDVEEFYPDRWLPENLTERQKICFNPFSYGPRACVGQNVAHMELALIIGTLFRRYDLILRQESIESHEGFSKKPEDCHVGIRKRKV